MRRAEVSVHNRPAGILTERGNHHYEFQYHEDYKGSPISLSIPLTHTSYHFDTFPPFFDGLLPEGPLLEALIRQHKIDKTDYFSQLLCVGDDLVGAVTVSELPNE